MLEMSLDLSALAIGRCRLVAAPDGRCVVVSRTTQGVRATAGLCPHQNLSLDGARILGGAVLCPHHGARFDLETGESRSPGLTARPLTIYPVREEGDSAIITLPEQEGASEGARELPGSTRQPPLDKRHDFPSGRE